MKTAPYRLLLLLPASLLLLASCKKESSPAANPGGQSPGSRISMITMYIGSQVYYQEKFYYSGEILDSVTHQEDLYSHLRAVWKTTCSGGLLQALNYYEQSGQQWKLRYHSEVQQYVNGLPASVRTDSYLLSDTAYQTLFYTYGYDNQGRLIRLCMLYANGAAKDTLAVYDITCDGGLRKQVYRHYYPGPEGDYSDDYTWSGTHLEQNVGTHYFLSGWVNAKKYLYQYSGDRVSKYEFYEWQDPEWNRIYTMDNSYTSGGDLSEQINTGYNGVVARIVYTYTGGTPLYRTFLRVSRPLWPLDSPAIPTPQ